MNFLVLGAGQMGYAVVYDLIRSPKVNQILLADVDESRIQQVLKKFSDDRVVPCKCDVSDIQEAASLMAKADVAISCVTYKLNYDLAKAALEARTHFVDLGGNHDIVQKEFMLDELARERDMAIIPDCGLAPGMVSILAAAAANTLEEIYEIRLRAGGLPIEPQPPLNYNLVFSVHGLINEYVEDATVIRGGTVRRVPSLEELEKIEFPQPFGTLEAFNTSGGISTLPQTFEGKVQYLDYKTIRYPGHCEQIRLLQSLGLMDAHPVEIDSAKVAPRDLLAHMLQMHLPSNEPDVVLLRVSVSGLKEGYPTEIVWEGIDYMDQAAELSAMARMTAFPASIIAQMVARGDITDRGTLVQEKSIPSGLFLAEIASRGIRLSMVEKSSVSS